jgi:hypothetical protein
VGPVDKESHVVSHRVERFALSLLAVLIASVSSACAPPSDGNPFGTPPTVANPPSSSVLTDSTPPDSSPPDSPPPDSTPTGSVPTGSVPTPSMEPEQETLAFGKSYRWDDGVTLTVGKPAKFQPSAYTTLDRKKRYVRFTVTVVNKSDKSLDLGLTYISAKSNNEEAQHVFDSVTGLKGPPDSKLPKGRQSKFDVGFGVADTKDVVMEIALHDDAARPSVLYST